MELAADITRAQAGSPAGDASRPSFDEVFEAHHARVRRYVVSRVGPDAADDVVADTFVAALRRWSTFDPQRGTDVLPWLLGYATHVLARHRAAEARWVERCVRAERDAAETPADFTDSSGDRVDALRRGPALAAALRKLPRREREPLLLHVLGGCSYEEVAAALEVPLGSVRSRISRGRRRLATWMEDTP